MKMKNLHRLVITMIPLLFAGCGGQEEAAPAADAARPHANVLQLMRAVPFIHANVIFDTQSKDPEGPEKLDSMAYSAYRWGDTDVYAGWSGVESSALALAEAAELLKVPGRLCANGLPAPVEREDWKMATQNLIDAGEAAYKAAQTRDMDAMLEVSETITNACASCHDVYRDIDQVGKMRCIVEE